MKNQKQNVWVICQIAIIFIITFALSGRSQTPKSSRNTPSNKIKTQKDSIEIFDEHNVHYEQFIINNPDKVYQIPEKWPQFKGGEDSIKSFIYKNVRLAGMKYEGNKGIVVLRFIVSKTGSVSHVEVVISLNPICDNEAIRVIKLLPDFIPGEISGIKVAVYYTLPVSFNSEYYLSRQKTN
jgi:TonB family protein